MKRSVLGLSLMLAATPGLAAEGLAAAWVGEYRPLEARAEARPDAGFDAAVLEGVATLMGERVRLTGLPGTAALRIGQLETGSAYFSSDVAALVATDGGPDKWDALRGRPFCIVAGHPYTDTVRTRFGGVAREYPSAAQALIGLKLGECAAVVGERLLLDQIAALPEWRRYNRQLPALDQAAVTLRVEATDAALSDRISAVMASAAGREQVAAITHHWIDEVAFQAYVLADTLDCH